MYIYTNIYGYMVIPIHSEIYTHISRDILTNTITHEQIHTYSNLQEQPHTHTNTHPNSIKTREREEEEEREKESK